MSRFSDFDTAATWHRQWYGISLPIKVHKAISLTLIVVELESEETKQT